MRVEIAMLQGFDSKNQAVGAWQDIRCPGIGHDWFFPEASEAPPVFGGLGFIRLELPRLPVWAVGLSSYRNRAFRRQS